MKRSTKILISIAIGLGVIGVAIWLGIGLLHNQEVPTSYMIQMGDNYVDYQKKLECSGYSSAYVLRQLGVEVTGLELYDQIPDKLDDGSVSPDNLVEALNEMGYKASIKVGDANQIKSEITKGIPVIAFVRVAPNYQYYHYLPIVGYDEENIYAVDSLSYMSNAKEENYNRKIKVDDFDKMLETFLDDKIYIKIELR